MRTRMITTCAMVGLFVTMTPVDAQTVDVGDGQWCYKSFRAWTFYAGLFPQSYNAVLTGTAAYQFAVGPNAYRYKIDISRSWTNESPMKSGTHRLQASVYMTLQECKSETNEIAYHRLFDTMETIVSRDTDGDGDADDCSQPVDDPNYDPYEGDEEGEGDIPVECGGGGASDMGGSGTQYEPGDQTGGELVEWNTGIGIGGSSACGDAAVVEFICLDKWDADSQSWVTWSCGYATVCG